MSFPFRIHFVFSALKHNQGKNPCRVVISESTFFSLEILGGLPPCSYKNKILGEFYLRVKKSVIQ
jgi:hypothetical protein